jgi:hypothetical protein
MTLAVALLTAGVRWPHAIGPFMSVRHTLCASLFCYLIVSTPPSNLISYHTRDRSSLIPSCCFLTVAPISLRLPPVPNPCQITSLQALKAVFMAVPLAQMPYEWTLGGLVLHATLFFVLMQLSLLTPVPLGVYVPCARLDLSSLCCGFCFNSTSHVITHHTLRLVGHFSHVPSFSLSLSLSIPHTPTA